MKLWGKISFGLDAFKGDFDIPFKSIDGIVNGLGSVELGSVSQCCHFVFVNDSDVVGLV